MEITSEQTLKKGIASHKAGKVQEAKRFYNDVLDSNRDHPEANHNLGVLVFEVGEVEEAISFFEKAIKPIRK